MLGFGAAVPPGPVNLEIARRATRGGYFAGASVGLGAVTVDVVLALLTSVGVLRLVQSTPWARVPISLIGVALLTYLGLGALRNLRRRPRGDEPTGVSPVEATPLRGYVTGLLICGTSPYQAAFWFTAVPGIMARSGGGAAGGSDAWTRLALCGGVFLATILWVATFSGVVTLAGRFDRGGWLPRAMDGVGGVLLLGFAALSAWRLGVELL